MTKEFKRIFMVNKYGIVLNAAFTNGWWMDGNRKTICGLFWSGYDGFSLVQAVFFGVRIAVGYAKDE